MNGIRFILLAVAVAIAWRLYKNWRARRAVAPPEGRRRAGDQRRTGQKPKGIDTIRCDYCGTHVPVGRELRAHGRTWCSRECRDADRGRSDGD
ncbi:MAG: PP0621 family protein [Thiohalospira sp.]